MKKKIIAFLMALMMVVGAVPFGAFAILATDAGAGTGAAVSETDVEADLAFYKTLYSWDGLLFLWTGYGLKEGDAQLTELVNEVEGSPVASVPIIQDPAGYTNDPKNGYLDTRNKIDLTAFLPYHMVGSLKVLDDMTLEVALKQQNYYTPEGRTNGCQMEMGPVYAFQFYYHNLTENNMADRGEPAENAAYYRPIDETYGYISSTYGVVTPQVGTVLETATDTAWRKIRFMGNTRGKPYTVGIRFDYDLREGETRGNYVLEFFRDSKLAVDDATGLVKAVHNARYDARYKGDYLRVATPLAAKNEIQFGGAPLSYQAIRFYDHALTQAEMSRNHFADIVSNYRPSTENLRRLDPEQIQALIDIYADRHIDDVTKEELETVFWRFVNTGGNLDFKDASAYISFAGAQVRVEDYAALRLRYQVDMTEVALVEAQGAQISIGVMYTDESYNGDMTAEFNPNIGEVAPTDDAVSQIIIYRGGEWGAQLDYLQKGEGNTYDVGVQLMSAFTDSLADDPLAHKEYKTRIYVAANMDGGAVIEYLDFDDALLGKTVSFAEVAQYFLYNGFENSSILASVVSPEVLLAAKAGASNYNTSINMYEQLLPLVDFTVGAYLGVAESRAEYVALCQEIVPTLSYKQAIDLASKVATARGELDAYAAIGQSVYDEVEPMLESLRASNLARRQAIVAALESTALGDAEKNALIEKVVANMESLTAKLEAKVSAQDHPFEQAETILQQKQVLDPLKAALSAEGFIYLNARDIEDYIIITDDAHMASALKIQEVLLANYGALLGVYSIDNQFTGNCEELEELTAITVGLTAKHLDPQKTSYAVYADGEQVYIEGTTPDATVAGVTAFLATRCIGKGIVDSSLNEGSLSLMAQPYVPMFTTNMQTEFPAVVASSYDADGVWEGFMQTMSEKPKEVTVLDRMLPENFAYSLALQVYVSNSGSDETGDGSIGNPYATLTRALDDVAYRTGGVIWLRGGTYSATELTAAHSGTITAPLFISAYGDEKVTFVAGKTIPAEDFVRVDYADFVSDDDYALFNKFIENNTDNIYAYNLLDAGFTQEDFAKFATYQDMAPVFVGDNAFHVARFPNFGAEDAEKGIVAGRVYTMNLKPGAIEPVKRVGRVHSTVAGAYYDQYKYDTGSWELWIGGTAYEERAIQYANTHQNLWMYGSVYEEWSNERFNVAFEQDMTTGLWFMKDLDTDSIDDPSMEGSWYGAHSVKAQKAALYFYNMPEDLDAENEYLIDIENMILYLYGRPTEDVTVATDSKTLMTVNGASHVVFNKIDFKYTSGDGILFKNADHVFVQDADMLGMSGTALTMTDCYMSGMIYSTVKDTYLAVYTDFNKRESAPTCNIIQNNVFGRRGSLPGLLAGLMLHGGFGDVVSHNKFIENGASVNYQLDLVFEYNDMWYANMVGHDSGPFYTAANCRGMHVRYNYMHELNLCGYGIYLDDMTSGNYIYGNVVHYDPNGRAITEFGNARGVNLHNGQMNVVYNNITINCTSGVVNQPSYSPKTINQKPTGANGALGQNWRQIANNFLNLFYTAFNQELLETRYPLWTYMNQFNKNSLPNINGNLNWLPHDKFSPAEDDEIMARSPVFNIYRNNVAYDCGSPISVPDFKKETCIVENNLSYDFTEDVGFVDAANGNYNLKEDSIIFREIPDFEALDLSKVGLTD